MTFYTQVSQHLIWTIVTTKSTNPDCGILLCLNILGIIMKHVSMPKEDLIQIHKMYDEEIGKNKRQITIFHEKN